MLNFFRSPNCNLTNTYYFAVIIRCLKHYRYRHGQSIFLNVLHENQFLEVLLTIIARYFKGKSSYPQEWLDNIVEEVKIRIKNKYPWHSMFCSSRFPEKLSFSEVNDIDDDLWNETEATQILSVLEEFLFSKVEVFKLFHLFDSLFMLDQKCRYNQVNYYV